MPLGEVGTNEREGERGAHPLKTVILPLLARLVYEPHLQNAFDRENTDDFACG